jgi:hypothetical protein
VPATGAFRPATNVLAFATDDLERARISPGGALLVGATAEPLGQIAGTVVANNKLIIGATSHGVVQRYGANFSSTITATTGTIVFRFKSSNTAIQRSALITVAITHASNSNAATNNPAAYYAFRVFNTDAGVCAIHGAATIMEYQYVRATHFAFADLGSGECTVTLTNPTGVPLFNSHYEITMITNGVWFLDTVTTT